MGSFLFRSDLLAVHEQHRKRGTPICSLHASSSWVSH